MRKEIVKGYKEDQIRAKEVSECHRSHGNTGFQWEHVEGSEGRQGRLDCLFHGIVFPCFKMEN